MPTGPFGTGFAQTGFQYDPNISPNNQAFSAAVLAVTKRNGLGTGGGGGGTGSVTSISGTAVGPGSAAVTVSGVPITTSGTFTLTISTFAGTAPGVVPSSAGGTLNFLRADGTFAAPPSAVSTTTLLSQLKDVGITTPADKQILVYNGTSGTWVNHPDYQPLFQRGASFSGGAAAIVVPTNNAAIYIPEDCNILSVEVLTAGGTGSCVLDIWRVPFASYPPTSANSITASAKPTITGGVTYLDSTLTGWSTALSAGDTLLVNLTSCSLFTYVMLVLTMKSVGSTTYDGYTNAQAIAAVVGQLANPTGTAILTEVNGTATTFMRSDAAPAIGQAIAPTWTGNHTFSPTSGVAVKINQASGTDGLDVLAVAGTAATISAAGNGVSAANGFQLQYSPGGNGNINLAGAIQMRIIPGTSITGASPVSGALIDMTPDKGTFGFTLTGVSNATTGTATWARQGQIVVLTFPTAIGTSNTTSCTLTGVPAVVQPASLDQLCSLADFEDNTLLVGGSYAVNIVHASSTWSFQKNGTAAGFVASGQKGTKLATITFSLQ